jgi:hypothetical protein
MLYEVIDFFCSNVKDIFKTINEEDVFSLQKMLLCYEILNYLFGNLSHQENRFNI